MNYTYLINKHALSLKTILKLNLMKKYYFLMLLVLCSLLAFSQEKMNKFSFNPIQLFASNITNFEYERGLKEGKFGVSLLYARTGLSTRSILENKIYMSEQSVTAKFYKANMNQSSLWYGGELAVINQSLYKDENSSRALIEALGISGKVGYQYIYKSLYADAYGGLGIAATDNLFGNAYYSGDYSKSIFLFQFGLKLGIVF